MVNIDWFFVLCVIFCFWDLIIMLGLCYGVFLIYKLLKIVNIINKKLDTGVKVHTITKTPEEVHDAGKKRNLRSKKKKNKR